VLCDEPPRYMNDPRAEEKYYDEVQAEKATLQSGQSTYAVFEFAEYNNRKLRVSRNVVTDNTVTYAYCKNSRARVCVCACVYFSVPVNRAPFKPHPAPPTGAGGGGGGGDPFQGLTRALQVRTNRATPTIPWASASFS
jgi:hypothetical protein